MNNGRPNNTNGIFGNAGPQQPGSIPSPAGYPQNQPAQNGYAYPQNQPMQNGYAYSQSQPVQNGYAYSQNQPVQNGYAYSQNQPVQNGYAYSQNQPVQNGYAYSQNQPVQNGYAYSQNQPVQNGYAYSQNQPVQNGYAYSQNQPVQNGYTYPQSQPMQSGFQQRVQPYPYQTGSMQPVVDPGQQPAAQPKQPKPRRTVNVDGLTRLVIFLAVPLLVVVFVLGLIYPDRTWLRWLFIVPALGVIATLWLRPVVTSDLKLTGSFVLGAMTVVALVGALSGAPKDNAVPPIPSAPTANTQQQVNTQPGGNTPVQDPGPLVDVPTTPPTQAPTEAPAVSSGLASDTVRQLESFLYFWKAEDTEKMVTLCAPSWVRKQQIPLHSLFNIINNRTPESWEATAITGTENDFSRTVSVTIAMNKNNGAAARRYMFKIIMVKENDIWYVDPESLVTNEPEATATPESGFITQPPLPAPAQGANQILYYNPNGGSRYHLDPDCKDVGEKYKPMAQLTFGQLNDDAFRKLNPCNTCGAPRRE